eukprot:GHVR01072209.1.p1 GENE.GHVR01072209.1~~GHVR01072209.1.p1  ORF type:complete len:272 (+),score=19.48 GHVR01072209.1:511-1326(+)
MKIARVFPTKTNCSPIDNDSYFDAPDLFTPYYDEVHISVTFTWDIEKGYKLANQWKKHGKSIKVGGVAINGESKEPMIGGMYLKSGITITSRGCPNNCSFCMVNRGLIEFDTFPVGNVIQDNNILACSDKHRERVWSMLRKQRGIEFKGGLESRRVTDKIAEDLRSVSTKQLWLACDHKSAVKPLKQAVSKLQKVGFTRSHLYCYVLIGKDKEEETERLYEVLNAGAIPFAQLFKDKDNSIEYSKEWKRFAREWSRPAIIRSKLKVTNVST